VLSPFIDKDRRFHMTVNGTVVESRCRSRRGKEATERKAIWRVTRAAVAVVCLAAICATGGALAASGSAEQERRIVSEAQADDEDLEEGSAWYPPATAQDSGQGGTGAVLLENPGTITDPERLAEKGKKPPSAEWLIAPVPFSNPTIGTGLVLASAYVFPIDENDSLSPPSVVGLGAMHSTNGSRAAVVGGMAYYNEDRHRLSGGIGHYDVTYDFYGTGNEAGDTGVSVPLQQRGKAFRMEYLRLGGRDLYFGARYTFSEARVSVEVEPPASWPGIPADQLRSTTGALGLIAERDTRDSTFYPTSGVLLEASVDFYGSLWGSDFTYQAYSVTYNSYRRLNEDTVLACRAYARQVGGNVPFYGLSLFGKQGDLRGYTAGQYRDKFMLALQSEYRQRVTGPWSYVVFAGVGEVAPRLTALNLDSILPSVGAGVRYTLAEENRINIRMDMAYGKEGVAVHFGVGESF
jgi:hypothetical protein